MYFQGFGNTAFFLGSSDVILTAFNSNHDMIYSTYYGGNGADWGNAILFDDSYQRIYITGTTGSPNNFPELNPQTGNYQQLAPGGANDAFIGRFDANTITSIESYKNFGNSILIYPNPTKNTLNILLNLGIITSYCV